MFQVISWHFWHKRILFQKKITYRRINRAFYRLKKGFFFIFDQRIYHHFYEIFKNFEKIESEIGNQVDLNLISPLVHLFKKYKPRANMKCHVVQTQTNNSIKKGSFFLQPRAHANFGFFNNGVTIPKAEFRAVVQIEGIYKHVENCQSHREYLT